ncbi:uncharacterized protein [Branchiostoma lanceolatum]|uniref:uncharacterized protein n=1 Tax=Branchiostoma lanceolatum TaxID=7740 RepID=UPI0034551DD4
MAYMTVFLVCLHILLMSSVCGFTENGNLTDNGMDQDEMMGNVTELEEEDVPFFDSDGDYDYMDLTVDSMCILNFLEQGGDDSLLDVVCPRKWPSEPIQFTMPEKETGSISPKESTDSGASRNPSGDDIRAFTSNPDHFESSNDNTNLSAVDKVAVPTISTKDKNSGLQNYGKHSDEDKASLFSAKNATATAQASKSSMTTTKEDDGILSAVKGEDAPVSSEERESVFMSDLDNLLKDSSYGDGQAAPDVPSSNDMQGDKSKLKEDGNTSLVKDRGYVALLYIKDGDPNNETKNDAMMNQGNSGTQMHKEGSSKTHQVPAATERAMSTNVDDSESHAAMMMTVELSVFLGSLFALVVFTLWLCYRAKNREDPDSPKSWLSDMFVIPRPWRRVGKARRFSWDCDEFDKI